MPLVPRLNSSSEAVTPPGPSTHTAPHQLHGEHSGVGYRWPLRPGEEKMHIRSGVHADHSERDGQQCPVGALGACPSPPTARRTVLTKWRDASRTALRTTRVARSAQQAQADPIKVIGLLLKHIRCGVEKALKRDNVLLGSSTPRTASKHFLALQQSKAVLCVTGCGVLLGSGCPRPSWYTAETVNIT